MSVQPRAVLQKVTTSSKPTVGQGNLRVLVVDSMVILAFLVCCCAGCSCRPCALPTKQEKVKDLSDGDPPGSRTTTVHFLDGPRVVRKRSIPRPVYFVLELRNLATFVPKQKQTQKQQ
jgi:hypothetical protein